MREGNIFSLSTLAGGTLSQVWMGVPYPRSRQGGTPSQVQTGGIPSQVWTGGYPFLLMGVPSCPRLDVVPLPIQNWMGYPPFKTECSTFPHHPRLYRVPPSKTGWGTPPLISKASTCYIVGGVLLTFTQEDFLVVSWFRYRLIVIFSATLMYVRNQNIEMSQHSSDLLHNIYNCIPKSFM